jgi:hypothetical protein
MPPKILKYLLIAGVIAIWGTVIYKVIAGQGEPLQKFTKPIPAMEISVNRPKETFFLFANYPDPFLADEEDIDTILNEPVPAPPLAPAPVTVAPDLSFIQYHGVITNTDKKSKVALISLHGIEWMIKEKETKEGILVRKIHTDSLDILFNNKKYSIHKN